MTEAVTELEEYDNMPYATGRRYHDADSHIMELHGWLAPYADPGIRESLQPLDLGRGGGAAAEKAVQLAEKRQTDGATATIDDHEIMQAKGWAALGAFDASERSMALDLLGFDSQLVFSTFAPTQYNSGDVELLYGGARALTRLMVDFCSGDERLLPVAPIPLTEPRRSEHAVADAIKEGAAAVLVPSTPQGEVSPTHPDFDGVWSCLEEAGVPFMLHVGGGGDVIPRAYHRNGIEVTDFLGGGENIKAKDYMALHAAPETFLSAMILDGVLERHPGLKGGCIELGGMWVVPWLQRLDIAQSTFVKTETALAMPLKASEYVHRQLWFTPFPTEPVGWMIEQAGDDLFLFSSDYPHPEGGRDPLKRFESSLGTTDETAKERFYSGNFADMMGFVGR